MAQWVEMLNEMDGLRWAMAALLGACVGSFLTMASWRLPRDASLIRPPSQCPACHTRLGVRDLLPILSWLVQKAKCRHCAAPIHWRYPAIELFCAAGFALIFGLSGIGWMSACHAVLFASVVLMIVTDLEHWMIPDEVHLLLLPLGIFYRYQQLGQWDGWELLLGPAVGLGTGLLLHYGYFWLRKRHGLGLGDVKFFATAGAWLGLMGLVPYFFFSGVAGVVFAYAWRFARRGHDDAGYFPFGPALACMLLLGVLWPEAFAFFFEAMRP